jgi:hypothetical protein
MITFATAEDVQNLQRQIDELKGKQFTYIRPVITGSSTGTVSIRRMLSRKKPLKRGGLTEKLLVKMRVGKVYRVSTLADRLGQQSGITSMALRTLVRRNVVEKISHGKYRKK